MKVAVTLQYLSNYWRSLEKPLINYEGHLESNWSKDCVISTIADTTFEITNTRLYAQSVNLSNKDKVKLIKVVEEGFRRPVHWNEYQTKIETRFSLNASFEGVTTLFVLAFNNTSVNVPNNPINNIKNRDLTNSHTQYFPPRVNIINYNVLINSKNLWGKLINELMKLYDQIRKTVTGQGDNYTIRYLLDYQYFKDPY